MLYPIKDGLIVGPEPGRCAGYILNFGGHGGYDPTGRIEVGGVPLTQEQVDTHNRILGEAEAKHAVETGRGVLYLTGKPGEYRVSTWAETFKAPWVHVEKSLTPGFNCSTRYHVHFTGPDGKRWYGINQGDSQIVRARRLKKQ